MPSHKRHQLNNLTEILLKKCTELGTTKEEWKDYEEIYNNVQAIRDIEKEYNVTLPNRDDKWENFLSWCSGAGANFETIDIKKLKDEEYGLVSKQLLNEGDVVLKVPRKLMMTTTTISEPILNNFVKKDPILQHMSNVVLALHLMNEYVNPDSFWKPYLSILPAEYNTVLYFTPEDLKELTGSPVKEECMKMYRNIARQYSYFYRQFQQCPELRSSPLRHYFTYDFYRWAVSTVMTRQNAVPSSDGNNFISALIPLWDMANHINGKVRFKH
ncbi:histone-lysine N-methyltransferase setd3-like [Centruroides sculpturatus]|uniref:histone-lysine N-methyltransferase setd3-like n=1 Tax=Centruroides sculpturatus TaxID=218467 RepID=UPI000C6D4904|nr:histone-lysine N-methyltransferase setd3-like [Centruroides sculpturatus]